MTGYQSKKKAASAKTIDEVNWSDHEPDGRRAAARDKLLELAQEGMNMHSHDAPEYIVCKALIEALAQPAQEPVCPECKAGVLYECVACSSNNYPAQQYANPMAWAVCDKRGGSKSLHWPEQHSPDGDATMFDAVPLVPQRPWVGLTEEQFTEAARLAEGGNYLVAFQRIQQCLKEKNNG